MSRDVSRTRSDPQRFGLVARRRVAAARTAGVPWARAHAGDRASRADHTRMKRRTRRAPLPPAATPGADPHADGPAVLDVAAAGGGARPVPLRERLPNAPAEFVGRAGERAFLRRALTRGRAAVVWGPGGLGKTALALD